ncbi:hypothetical protein [Streptomyces shenzhenensis]|uniref:Uncharacterized protein n=1 Tax=Streptomyces shenzhenensis TaxID=943815 RepID=A0A3M0I9X0_9ACTN|nr:hypothetical protein [Streptomyces shenzhenensis]RMB85614.1 hypothetical protein CTZ28_12540 [Streptomyces shenzhenensis]
MTDLISTLISAFGVLASTMVLTMFISSGASVAVIGICSAAFLIALYALVRDVRRLRARRTI